MPGHDIDADGAEQESEGGHQQRADQRTGRHVSKEDQPQQQQRGVFRRAKPQREGCERRRDQREHDDAERAGNERADRRNAKRRAAAAFPCHRIAVDAGHHRGGFARYAQQDRRGRAAVLRAVVDAGQHHDRIGGVEPERQRQQDADTGERSDARQHADQRSDDAADEGVPQHVRPQRDRKSQHQAVECFHRVRTTAGRVRAETSAPCRTANRRTA